MNNGIRSQLRMKMVVDQKITEGLIIRKIHTEEAMDRQSMLMAGDQGLIITGSAWEQDEKVYELDLVEVGKDVLDPEPEAPAEAVEPAESEYCPEHVLTEEEATQATEEANEGVTAG